MASGYVYDQAWHDERARLAGIEALWDPGTQALLAGTAGPGSRVLEVGAGRGSVVSWLATQVGATGSVVAVDLDTRFLAPLRSDVVDVRQADVVTDELPVGAFDVVHARLLLEHLPQRDEVLDKLVAALCPGGTLVVEDYDWTGFGWESADEAEERVTEGILQLMTAAGFDRAYGRRVVSAFAERGLEEVTGEGRSLVVDDTHPGFAFFRLSFEQAAPLAVEAGLMTAEDLELVGGRLREGGRRLITPTLVAAVGRAPLEAA